MLDRKIRAESDQTSRASPRPPLKFEDAEIWYTDGSKKTTEQGAAILGCRSNLSSKGHCFKDHFLWARLNKYN